MTFWVIATRRHNRPWVSKGVPFPCLACNMYACGKSVPCSRYVKSWHNKDSVNFHHHCWIFTLSLIIWGLKNAKFKSRPRKASLPSCWVANAFQLTKLSSKFWLSAFRYHYFMNCTINNQQMSFSHVQVSTPTKALQEHLPEILSWCRRGPLCLAQLHLQMPTSTPKLDLEVPEWAHNLWAQWKDLGIWGHQINLAKCNFNCHV